MRTFLPRASEHPVIEKIFSFLTPEEVFKRFSDHENVAFLHSSMKTDVARYSYIGLYPFFSISGKGSATEISLSGHKIRVFGSPFEILKSAIRSYRTTNETDMPFVAGGIGYFSYEAGGHFELLPPPEIDDIAVPDIFFVFYRVILIFDNENPGSFYISVLDMPDQGGYSPKDLIFSVKKQLNSAEDNREENFSQTREKEIISNFSKTEYIQAVEKILGHIKEGDIYQACLSQRFHTHWPYSSFLLYRALNALNPAPFSAYLNFGKLSIVSSSPELFIRRSGDIIETRPMKGTRARGSSNEEDEKLMRDLCENPKEISELIMIVDLMRNDIGKVALPGTVNVEEDRRIETYPTVFQAISVIKGKINECVDDLDILRSVFPGGSITGCPKIRAIQILNGIEKHARGVYTGSIGYLSFHDSMCMNIAIRTMTIKNKGLYFGSGGAIVFGSDPEKEYEETLIKSRALINAIKAAEDNLKKR